MSPLNDRQIGMLIELLTQLPGMGPRSARRAALYILSRQDMLLTPLQKTLADLQARITLCEICFMVATRSPCEICADPRRTKNLLCVVEETTDVWAIERAEAHRGHYHVLGGALNALEGIGPEDLHIEPLITRVKNDAVSEIILATNATIEGQTSAHYLAERLSEMPVKLSRLARGLPIGSELDYMDDGTIMDAMRQRRPF